MKNEKELKGDLSNKFSKFAITKNWGKGLNAIRGGSGSSCSTAFTLCSAPYCDSGTSNDAVALQ